MDTAGAAAKAVAVPVIVTPEPDVEAVPEMATEVAVVVVPVIVTPEPAAVAVPETATEVPAPAEDQVRRTDDCPLGGRRPRSDRATRALR